MGRLRGGHLCLPCSVERSGGEEQASVGAQGAHPRLAMLSAGLNPGLGSGGGQVGALTPGWLRSRQG